MARFNPNDAGKPTFTFEPGRYRGVVEDAAEEISKRSQKAMVHFTFKFFRRTPDGGEAFVFVHDYARLDLSSGLWTLQEVAKAAGCPEAFASGDSDAVIRAVKGRTIEAELDVQQQQGYDDKNTVTEYYPKAASGAGQSMRRDEPARQDYRERNDYATSLPEDGLEEPPF